MPSYISDSCSFFYQKFQFLKIGRGQADDHAPPGADAKPNCIERVEKP
jgi:hypothetical protein